MEEKKKSIIPMWACLLILILVVGCAGLGYMWYTQKTDVDKKKDEICELEKDVDTLEEKIISLENEIEESKKEATDNNNNNNNATTENILTEEEALKLGKEKYEEAISLDLILDDSAILKTETVNSSVMGEIENPIYKVEGISEIKKVLSDNAFKYFCKEWNIVEINGEYGHPAGNRGFMEEYENSTIKSVDEITENKITYTVEANYKENSYFSNGEEKVVPAHKEENKFVLVKENGEWKVDEYTIPN